MKDSNFVKTIEKALDKANIEGNKKMAIATEEQLRERWLTPEGKKVRKKIIDHIRGENWEKFLLEFPFVKEIVNGRDLRFINLKEANLVGANLVGANLLGAYLRETNLWGADLWRANLVGAFLREANLMGAYLEEAFLAGAFLGGANLWGANLWGANLVGANLLGAYLEEADLRGADLRGADFFGANLERANLERANLSSCHLIRTDISGADLTDAYIYGISTWDIKTDKKTIMKNLIISKDPLITVDDIEIAQFMNLIINNKKITNIITSMRTKAVLILGSFRKENKQTLDLIKQIVLKNKESYIPIVFDFNPSNLQTLTDTIRVLSLLSRFTIIDITEPAGQLIELGRFDELRVPYAIILSERAKHISGPVEKHVLNEWCYKESLILYSADNKKKELDELINNGIAVWAEEKNKEYEEGIIKFRKNTKEINKTLGDKNEKGKDKRQELS